MATRPHHDTFSRCVASLPQEKDDHCRWRLTQFVADVVVRLIRTGALGIENNKRLSDAKTTGNVQSDRISPVT